MTGFDQPSLVHRLLDHVERGSTDLAEQTEVRSVDPYREMDNYQEEMQRVIRRYPVIAAHVSQFSEPGSYLADDMAGVPILLVRQESGEIRGFANACRHRGTRLVVPGTGTATADGFTCPWHGWRYDTAGGLCGIPDGPRGFPELDQSTRGLLPFRTEVRYGFVWITLDDYGDDEPRTLLDDLDGEFGSHQLGTYSWYGASRQNVRFNWKLGVEAFLETYHFRWLHPAMKKYVFAPDLSLVDEIGRHVRLVAPKKSVLGQKEVDAGERLIGPHATIAYNIFPSTMLFLEKTHVSVMTFLPTAPDACDVRFLHIVRDDTLSRRAYWDDNIGKFMDAADEDYVALELTQDGFGRQLHQRTAGHDTVMFGRNERGLQLFRRNLDEALAGTQER
jgi:phenylpropionate dioxygenase-like ring-hydroxylating dioxygenase large terminal subunit